MDARCVFFIVFVSSLSLVTCVGLSCYVCMWSSNEEPCGDAEFSISPEQDGFYMFNCSVCYKKVQIDSKGIKLKILRGCVRNEWAYEPICQSTKYLNGLSTQVCACTTDYCNSASTLTQASLFFLTFLAIVIQYMQ